MTGKLTIDKKRNVLYGNLITMLMHTCHKVYICSWFQYSLGEWQVCEKEWKRVLPHSRKEVTVWNGISIRGNAAFLKNMSQLYCLIWKGSSKYRFKLIAPNKNGAELISNIAGLGVGLPQCVGTHPLTQATHPLLTAYSPEGTQPCHYKGLSTMVIVVSRWAPYSINE